ncbi:MAG: type II toxin-antitoxin system MqsA family antitoxin [Deltaproteobacteria bacterium]|nr:type II toxin-antitoxin system MqsA family antitoxin [Deltaproteobacteria bacterium]
MPGPVCPNEGTPMRRAERPQTLNYKGESIIFNMPGWYCGRCGEGIHTGADMKVSDRALNLLKARVEGLAEPEEIKRIRQKLHLSQTKAGCIIGGGPRAFQKYESGDLLPSRAAVSALWLLELNPAGLQVLEQRTQRAHSSGHVVFKRRRSKGKRSKSQEKATSA